MKQINTIFIISIIHLDKINANNCLISYSKFSPSFSMHELQGEYIDYMQFIADENIQEW